MTRSSVVPSLLIAAALLCPRAAAQHTLAVKDGDKMLPVVAADGAFPVVKIGEKPELFREATYALLEGGEYLPKFVALRDLQVNRSLHFGLVTVLGVPVFAGFAW